MFKCCLEIPVFEQILLVFSNVLFIFVGDFTTKIFKILCLVYVFVIHSAFTFLLGLVLKYIKYETKPKPVCLFYLWLRIYFLHYVIKRYNVTPRMIAIRFVEAKMSVMHENSKYVNLAHMKDIVLE